MRSAITRSIHPPRTGIALPRVWAISGRPRGDDPDAGRHRVVLHRGCAVNRRLRPGATSWTAAAEWWKCRLPPATGRCARSPRRAPAWRCSTCLSARAWSCRRPQRSSARRCRRVTDPRQDRGDDPGRPRARRAGTAIPLLFRGQLTGGETVRTWKMYLTSVMSARDGIINTSLGVSPIPSVMVATGMGVTVDSTYDRRCALWTAR